jgi:DNA-binding IclR family transcriptional regulator
MATHGGNGPDRGAPGRTLSTARHVLQALEIIARHPWGIPVKALARQLNISLSSGYYLVGSMREQGFVEPSRAASGLYTLGPKFAELYRGYVAASLQPERLQPVLEELRDRASARAYAALWRDGDLEVVEIRGRRGSRELPDVTKGFRGAAHALALGKVYLSSLPRPSGLGTSGGRPTGATPRPPSPRPRRWPSTCGRSATRGSPSTCRSSPPAPAVSPFRCSVAPTRT